MNEAQQQEISDLATRIDRQRAALRPSLTRENVLRSVGEGWRPTVGFVYDFIAYVNATLPVDVQPVRILQVKEKFGGLRFYVDYSTPEVDLVIRAAGAVCDVTCEFCGAPGVLRNDQSWLKTLCDGCNANRNEERKARSV